MERAFWAKIVKGQSSPRFPTLTREVESHDCLMIAHTGECQALAGLSMAPATNLIMMSEYAKLIADCNPTDSRQLESTSVYQWKLTVTIERAEH